MPSILGARFQLESVIDHDVELGATVYLARDIHTQCDVIIVLSDNEHSVPGGGFPCARVPLRSHPGLLNLIESERPGERPYLALEMPQGQPLGQRIAEQGRYAASDFAGIGSQILLAVSHLHEVGLVHRRLHVNNLYIQGSDPRTARVKVGGLQSCFRVESPTQPELLQGPPWMEAAEPEPSDDVLALAQLFKSIVELDSHQGFGDALTQRRLLSLCELCMDPDRRRRPANAREMLESFVECFTPSGSMLPPMELESPMSFRPQATDLRRHRSVSGGLWAALASLGLAAAAIWTVPQLLADDPSIAVETVPAEEVVTTASEAEADPAPRGGEMQLMAAVTPNELRGPSPSTLAAAPLESAVTERQGSCQDMPSLDGSDGSDGSAEVPDESQQQQPSDASSEEEPEADAPSEEASALDDTVIIADDEGQDAAAPVVEQAEEEPAKPAARDASSSSPKKRSRARRRRRARARASAVKGSSRAGASSSPFLGVTP